jgi:dethiobiotin synthetase
MQMGAGGLFITGTDTDVGKTRVAAAIVRHVRGEGCHVGVYKPVASGVPSPADETSDAFVLWDAAGRPLAPSDVCPQAFAAAIAPAASARAEGRVVDELLLRTGLDRWRQSFEMVVVEGAGGLFSPLGDATLVVDLAREFALPVVIVDAARLGAIGRSLAVIRAARAEGLSVAAVVLSHVSDPGSATGPAAPRTIACDAAAEIESRAGVPVVILEHGSDRMPSGIDWRRLAGR